MERFEAWLRCYGRPEMTVATDAKKRKVHYDPAVQVCSARPWRAGMAKAVRARVKMVQWRGEDGCRGNDVTMPTALFFKQPNHAPGQTELCGGGTLSPSTTTPATLASTSTAVAPIPYAVFCQVNPVTFRGFCLIRCLFPSLRWPPCSSLPDRIPHSAALPLLPRFVACLWS